MAHHIVNTNKYDVDCRGWIIVRHRIDVMHGLLIHTRTVCIIGVHAVCTSNSMIVNRNIIPSQLSYPLWPIALVALVGFKVV